jgi:vacuolar-type H+-ATPase subunit E/Vma4
MITVESKLDLFNKVVLEKVRKEEALLLESLEAQRMEMLKNQEVESTKKADDFLKAIIDEAYEEKKVMLARAKSDVKKKVLHQRQALIDHLAEAVLHRFEIFVEDPSYGLFVNELIRRHKEDLQDFGKFSVMLDGKHFERDCEIVRSGLEIIGLEAQAYLESEDPIVGGCIFYNERRDVLIDGSLASLIEGHRREIGQRMYVMLNEVGDSNDA